MDRNAPISSPLFTCAWISLVVTGAGILAFGLVAIVHPVGPDSALFRSVGVASVGMGLFGIVITVTGFRERRPWAWFALWYYPVFWTAHLVGRLPPGYEHIHQVIFMVLSVGGLLLPARAFFPPVGSPP